MYHHLHVCFSVSSCLLDVCHFYKSLLWHAWNFSGKIYTYVSFTYAFNHFRWNVLVKYFKQGYWELWGECSQFCSLNSNMGISRERALCQRVWIVHRGYWHFNILESSMNRVMWNRMNCYNATMHSFCNRMGSEVSTVFKLSYCSGAASVLPCTPFPQLCQPLVLLGNITHSSHQKKHSKLLSGSFFFSSSLSVMLSVC